MVFLAQVISVLMESLLDVDVPIPETLRKLLALNLYMWKVDSALRLLSNN